MQENEQSPLICLITTYLTPISNVYKLCIM